MTDFRSVLKMSETERQDHYALIMQELSELHDKTGWLQATIHKDSIYTFERSVAQSIAARDREAKYATVDAEAQLLQDQAHIQALEVERAFLERFL